MDNIFTTIFFQKVFAVLVLVWGKQNYRTYILPCPLLFFPLLQYNESNFSCLFPTCVFHFYWCMEFDWLMHMLFFLPESTREIWESLIIELPRNRWLMLLYLFQKHPRARFLREPNIFHYSTLLTYKANMKLGDRDKKSDSWPDFSEVG